MSTYADLVTDSMAVLGALAETESASAEQGALGVRWLNEMMAEWARDGIVLGYVPTESPTDTLVLNMGYRETVKFNLAVLLAPIYGKPLDAVTAAVAVQGRSKALRDSLNRNLPISDLWHLPRGNARTRSYILTDTP